MSETDERNKAGKSGGKSESMEGDAGTETGESKEYAECYRLDAWIKNHRDRGRSSRWWNDLPLSGTSHYRHGQWWADIGDEVVARKTLWLTAVEELKARDTPEAEARKLAAADVLVEGMQRAIARRAKSYFVAGLCMSFLTITAMLYVAVFLFDDLWKGVDRSVDSFQFALVVVRMLTIGGLVAGAGYLMVSIARAFLHEGTVLFERRHAIHFGLLYVYLSGEEVKFSELEAAFNRNREIHTAFSDIRADKATRSIAQFVAEAGVEAIKTGAAAAKGDGSKRAFRLKV